MQATNSPTLGLALSGSGNRTTFYIGFLEALTEAGIKIDYLSAMSGGSLVAAAYACGTLEEFKKEALTINKETIKKYLNQKSTQGGLYSLENLAEHMRAYTKGLTFEEVKPLMSFVTVDIESGEQVDLCMGDIAQAATVSCVLPGIFEPMKWGNRTLVDGGILSVVPIEALKKFPVDITVAVSMRGTKHIFTETQLNFKKVYNFFKKMLFIDEMESFFNTMLKTEDEDFEDFSKKPGLFTVLGKSLDLAIKASKNEPELAKCDLLIVPEKPKLKRMNFDEDVLLYFYSYGRQVGAEYAPKIQQLVTEKAKVTV